MLFKNILYKFLIYITFLTSLLFFLLSKMCLFNVWIFFTELLFCTVKLLSIPVPDYDYISMKMFNWINLIITNKAEIITQVN